MSFKEELNKERNRLIVERNRTFIEPEVVVSEVRDRLSEQLIKLPNRTVTNQLHISMHQYFENLIKECDETPNIVLQKERINYDNLITSIDEDAKIFNDDGEII